MVPKQLHAGTRDSLRQGRLGGSRSRAKITLSTSRDALASALQAPSNRDLPLTSAEGGDRGVVGCHDRAARRFGLGLRAMGLGVFGQRPSEMVQMNDLDRRLDMIARHPFRAKFHMRGRDRAMVELRGMRTIRLHARELIFKRLALAAPYKDGNQTPYRGHPVFVAQHATATCCRTCFERCHEISKGQELSAEEQNYVVDVICRWIEREFERAER